MSSGRVYKSIVECHGQFLSTTDRDSCVGTAGG